MTDNLRDIRQSLSQAAEAQLLVDRRTALERLRYERFLGVRLTVQPACLKQAA